MFHYLRLIVITAVFLGNCQSGSQTEEDQTPAWLPEASSEWETATPQEVNIDQNRLNSTYQSAAELNHLKSLLVVRNGLLVGEAYYQGISSTQNHDVRSVTKTVMGLLVGKAIELNIIASIDSPIGPFFLDRLPDLSEEKQNITIGQLLTMTAGFQWDESSSSGYTDWATSADPIGFVLNRPLESEPGQTFRYNSGAVHLLSVILSAATDQSTLAFAQDHLFEPLGFSNLFWEQLAEGNYNGGAGLDLRPRDMAKLGVLLLNEGVWDGEQVINSSWIRQAAQPTRQTAGTYGPIQNINYGYLWWLGHAQSHDLQLAWGWGGQFIVTIPSLDLCLITTSNWQIGGSQANNQETANLNLLVNELLPGVHINQ